MNLEDNKLAGRTFDQHVSRDCSEVLNDYCSYGFFNDLSFEFPLSEMGTRQGCVLSNCSGDTNYECMCQAVENVSNFIDTSISADPQSSSLARKFPTYEGLDKLNDGVMDLYFDLKNECLINEIYHGKVLDMLSRQQFKELYMKHEWQHKVCIPYKNALVHSVLGEKYLFVDAIVELIISMIAVIPDADMLRKRRIEHWQNRLQSFFWRNRKPSGGRK